jgi:hypothetical protein
LQNDGNLGKLQDKWAFLASFEGLKQRCWSMATIVEGYNLG